MPERFSVPVEFQRLDDVKERGHEAVVALKAELDDASLAEPDEAGVLYVEIEAESQEEANDMVWHALEQARVTDFVDFVGRRTI
jgi:histidinol dehydrogenase